MEKNELIIKIMDLAYQIQLNTNLFAWITFSGHVGQLEIMIAPKSDWKNLESIIKFYDENISNDELLRNVELLENILNNKK